jgi:hypothetical protein
MNIKNHKIQQQSELDIHTLKITSAIRVLPEHIGCWWNFVFSYTEF